MSRQSDEIAALDYLSRNQLLHIDMIESIRRGLAEQLEVNDNGVLLWNRPGQVFMISAETPEAATRILEHLPAGELFVSHQAHCAAAIQNRFGLGEGMPCHQAALLGGQSPAPSGINCEIRPLDTSHLDFVLAHYDLIDDPPYIHERLADGTMFGAYVGDILAGFIGEHAEGSLGMLEVLPSFRRQGIAMALASFATRRQQQMGFTPYSQIRIGNQASMALQRKLGYAISEETVSWVF